MDQNLIKCPNCDHEFLLSEAKSHELEESLKKQFEVEREKEREEERKKMLSWKEKLESEQEEKEKKLKTDLEEEIKKKVLGENEKELLILREENARKEKALKEAQSLELELRKEKNKLNEEKESFELEKQRQLDSEREKIKADTAAQILKEHQLNDAQKNKQMEDMKKKIEELQQKANLTSQQLQGEVLELELEEFLKKEFPLDEILPVAKGVRGADVLQKVKDQMGREVGTIIWESKRTKNWTEEWVSKLKDDMRASGADVAILVSSVLPAGIKYFGPKDGIFVTSFDCILGVSAQIRLALVKENQIKGSVVGKNEKMEVLWNYLSSNQFSQKIEAIVEAFSVMREDLEREKRAFTQIWSKREKQIERVINNTVGFHGELQGLMGASLPQIKSAELDGFEMIETTEIESDGINLKQTTFTEVSVEES